MFSVSGLWGAVCKLKHAEINYQHVQRFSWTYAAVIVKWTLQLLSVTTAEPLDGQQNGSFDVFS